MSGEYTYIYFTHFVYLICRLYLCVFGQSNIFSKRPHSEKVPFLIFGICSNHLNIISLIFALLKIFKKKNKLLTLTNKLL